MSNCINCREEWPCSICNKLPLTAANRAWVKTSETSGTVPQLNSQTAFTHVSPFIPRPHYFSFHRNITKQNMFDCPGPPVSPPSHNVILRNVETIQPPFDFGGQNDYQIGRPPCWCACASVREEGKRDRVCEEFPPEIPLRDSRGCVIHFLSSWQIDHVHLTASWVISRHVGFNTPLRNRSKKNNFGEEKS